MSTEVQQAQKSKTEPAGQNELIAQGFGLSNLRSMSQGLAFQSAMARAALGLPFDESAYSKMSREELGLGPSPIASTYDAQARERILAEYHAGARPMDGPVRDSLREVAEENAARQSYIAKQRADYEQVATNPLTQLQRDQMSLSRELMPFQSEAMKAQAGASLQQARLLQDAGIPALRSNLEMAQRTATGANADETTLRGDVTDLATKGRAASPAQQAIIDQIYKNRLAGVESDLSRQYEDSTRLLPEVATARGIRVNSADLPDRYAFARREFLRQGGQAATALGAEAAGQSLNYPLQLGSLNLQQQQLTGQQQSRLPNAVGAISNPLFAYDPNAAFGLPLNLLSAGQGGVSSATAFQSPFLQSRLANTMGMMDQGTGGTIPALGASGSILGGAGLAAAGAVKGFSALAGGAAAGGGAAAAGTAGLAMGCWIAEVLYGKGSPEVTALRWYIWGPLSRTATGYAFARLYLRYGERLAAWMTPRPLAQRLIKPLFNRLLRQAIRAQQSEQVWA